MADKRRSKGDGALFQRADGYWVARVELPPGPNGERRRKRIVRATKTAAAAELRSLRTKVENGEVADSRSVTVKTWCEHWLAEIAPGKLRPRALATARSYLTNHVIPAIGRKRLDRLMPDDVREVTRGMTRPKADGGKGLATGTAANVHWLMSGVFGDAVKAGRASRNVVDRVDPPAVKRTARRPLGYDEAVKVLQHLAGAADAARGTDGESDAVRALARWSFGIFVGARQEDVLGLEWSRVDLDTGEVDISWALQWLPLRKGLDRTHRQKLRGDGTVYNPEVFAVDPSVIFRPVWRSACLVETKTRRARVVPLIPPLVAALGRLRELTGGEGLVFTRDDGRPVFRNDDTAAWNTLTARLGIEGVTQHGARHTTATLLLEAGVPEDVRMAILGHNTQAAHRGYAHVDQSVARAALEGTFGRMLDPTTT